MANTAHGGNNYWYITRKSYVVYRIISTHLFSLAPQFSRRHSFATVFWCWNFESKWCSNVSFTLKKANPRMINATAIYITPVHSCQVCLFPSVIFEGFDSCVRRSNLNQLGFKSSIFRSVWPLNLMVDFENNRTPLPNYVKRCASFQSHRWIGSGEYASFPPQPPGLLVSWGYSGQKCNTVIQEKYILWTIASNFLI